MGFNKVYKSLQEIFPQIDARVLRAVAIEHSKDVDAAVETVLTEIIPFFTEHSRRKAPSTGSNSNGKSSGGAISINTAGTADGQNGNLMNDANQQSLDGANYDQYEPLCDKCNGHDGGEGDMDKLTSPKNILLDGVQRQVDAYSHVEEDQEEMTRTQMNIDVNSRGEAEQLINKDSGNLHRIVSRDPSASETISDDKLMERSVKNGSDDKFPENSIKISSDDVLSHSLGITQVEDNGINQNPNPLERMVDNSHLVTEFNLATDESYHGKSFEEDNESVVGPTSLAVHSLTARSSESDSHLSMLNVSDTGLEESDLSLPEDESTLNASLSQSSQINMPDALEEIIAGAGNYKKTLFSSMQSVINWMREVEIKEQAAEHAKVEASMGGSEILVRSEELKKLVQQAEGANAMHAGEVFGEKAILATELKELQSRVLSLSCERDKSLALLDEMRQNLEVRLTEAQSTIESAEQERLEKEKAAMKDFADQKLIMEKVVQRSKILKQQAEDNAKLREFLVDRGRVVDTLQGEIAVICQDVRLLKENFDGNVPLSKSLSSSQTSCILASSSSSNKSFIPEPVDGVDSMETQKDKGGRSPSRQSFEEEDAAREVDRKSLLDDGWDVFDHQEIYS